MVKEKRIYFITKGGWDLLIPSFIFMKTSIQISKETWKKLLKLRLDLDAKDFDDVINRILKIVTKVELADKIELMKNEPTR